MPGTARQIFGKKTLKEISIWLAASQAPPRGAGPPHPAEGGPLSNLPTHPILFFFVPDTELLGTVHDPACELEEAVNFFEINYINYITVDFPALRLNVFKDK